MANIREKLDDLNCGMDTLVVFRRLLDDKVLSVLKELLRESAEDNHFNIGKYSQFVSELYSHNVDFSKYLLKAVLEDENFYIRGRAKGSDFDDNIKNAVSNELAFLQELSRLTPEEASYGYYRRFPLPQWKNSELDFADEYKKRIADIGLHGYGKFAKSPMFIFRNGEIVPVKHPDKQRLSELYGYGSERQAVIDNTLALLDGKPAQNVLLYGDAGTGKSSTVKAVVNEYADRGLRLIEITKEQLRDIPDIIEEIGANPLKFIIFIDDLSFVSGEDCFGALKATLEGSVSARNGNTAIYATSNRRHLVKESFADREGDDIHRNDSMQETLSLSARFGLRVNFSKPDKKSYIAIVQELAGNSGIEMSGEELALRAEQFAMQGGSGRSPRTAKQFVNQLINEKRR